MSDTERRSYDKDIALLFDKLDEHFKEESSFRQEFSVRVSGIEQHIESMDTYIQRVTEILERVTIIEERDKNHNRLIEDIGAILKAIEKQVQTNKDEAEKKIGEVDKKVDKWVYTITGAVAVITLIASIFGSTVNDKIKVSEELADKTKLHLEIDKPAGWPPIVPIPVK